MLAIRMQRTGRKGHAQFRVIVQESRLSPKSGRVVAAIGNYDPHTKVANLDTEKAEFYLGNGAQPSNAVAKLFSRNKVKLPEWVEIETNQERSTRHAEKLRKNQPAEASAPEAKEETAEDAPIAEDAPAEETAPADAEEKDEAPAQEPEAPKTDETKDEKEAAA